MPDFYSNRVLDTARCEDLVNHIQLALEAGYYKKQCFHIIIFSSTNQPHGAEPNCQLIANRMNKRLATVLLLRRGCITLNHLTGAYLNAQKISRFDSNRQYLLSYGKAPMRTQICWQIILVAELILILCSYSWTDQIAPSGTCNFQTDQFISCKLITFPNILSNIPDEVKFDGPVQKNFPNFIH